jgi:hypothetical protein
MTITHRAANQISQFAKEAKTLRRPDVNSDVVWVKVHGKGIPKDVLDLCAHINANPKNNPVVQVFLAADGADQFLLHFASGSNVVMSSKDLAQHTREARSAMDNNEPIEHIDISMDEARDLLLGARREYHSALAAANRQLIVETEMRLRHVEAMLLAVFS